MTLNCASAEDVLKTIKDANVKMVDLRFTDLPGVWQHFSVPPSAVDAGAFAEGIGFDGSSIRGFQEIQESDMLVVPDPTTAFLDPFTETTTLVLICNVRDPVTGQAYSRDSRYIAQTAEAHIKRAGQAEIDMRFTPLTRMADNLMLYKYVVKNVARKHGMTATFMPKPLIEDNASGMHVHQSLWKGETNLFYGEAQYAGLSELGRYYIGGLLTHAWALCGLCAPTTNSYRRLVPGYESPINLGYSQRNRSACCRIPMYSPNPRAKPVEFRSPDPSCNPYLALSAMRMAAVDGIT